MYASTHTASQSTLEAAPATNASRDPTSRRLPLLALLLCLLLVAVASQRDGLTVWPGDPDIESAPPVETRLSPSVGGSDSAEAHLSAPLGTALVHMARRYRVAASPLRPVFAAIDQASRDTRLDPLLLVAVIAIESGFNPVAESPMGAQGLMQVIPRFHVDKVPADAGTDEPFLDPVTNVRIGALALQEAIRLKGSLEAGLQHYGGATDAGNSYAMKVLAEKERLEQFIAARSASPRAPSPASSAKSELVALR